MAEALSPNELPNHRPPDVSRVNSPPYSYSLASNNDLIESAESRAAAPPPPPSSPSSSGLTNDQIIELFHNCIKLAAQNKINQRNTWELNLIDHLSEIINVESGNDAATNFRKASCTLEAGVKIYSLRVDSLHAEANRMLGRITRAEAQEELVDAETGLQDNSVNANKDDQWSRKASREKISPLSTVEQSFETFNIKKFDVAFAVDPLYHLTSAQFDEGGAKGLLLNNLGVYGGCIVPFDSTEVPGTFTSCFSRNANLDTINISFVREEVEQMVANMLEKSTEISPSLSQIFSQLVQCCGIPNHNGKTNSPSRMDVNIENEVRQNVNWFCDMQGGSSDYEEESSVDEEKFASGGAGSLINLDRKDHFFGHEDMKERYKGFPFCFSQSFSPNQNIWVGPEYWKYTKPKDADVHTTEKKSAVRGRSRSNKLNELDISLSESLDPGLYQIFAPPKNGKSLLLPVNREIQSNKLPEDCHYRPEDLLKLFLLPNVSCIGKVGERISDGNPGPENGFDHQMPSWDNESACSSSGQCNDSHVCGDPPDSNEFVHQPRQVNKIEVQYEINSKQVDVHLLKNCLWNHMQESIQVPEFACKVPLSFKSILATLPRKCEAATPDNISPHLCFICLLHLANEHGFSIQACPKLDDLSINIPCPLECK